MPGIKFTIAEDDVGAVLKVLFRVATTKVVKSPVILRSESILVLTRCSVGSFIPLLRREEHI
jgi:hypothetical protein